MRHQLVGDGWEESWRCSCGWRPTSRALGIRKGYTELTAVKLHIAQKRGLLCSCECELDYHYAGHGACNGEVRFMGDRCPCRKFRKKIA